MPLGQVTRGLGGGLLAFWLVSTRVSVPRMQFVAGCNSVQYARSASFHLLCFHCTVDTVAAGLPPEDAYGGGSRGWSRGAGE
jgi:hypothetical protein